MQSSDVAPDLSKELADLRDTLAWTDLVIASISEAVMVLDHTWRVVFVNDALAKIAKQPRIMALGKFPWEILPLENGGMTLAEACKQGDLSIKRCASLNSIYSTKQDGEEGILSVSLAYIPKLNQAVMVLRNITEEYKVDAMKSDFISLASHQLRTPLTGIMLNAHLLDDGYAGKLTPAQKKLLDRVLGSTDRMTELITMLLNITRAEAGKLKIKPEPTNLASVARGIVSELDPEAKSKNIKVTMHASNNLPVINTDQAMVNEIFANFLSNAITYTPPHGSVSIDLREAKNEIVAAITDTGYGIPKTEQNQIFTKFYRGTNILKQDVAGTGLGLYLVKQVVQILGGRVGFKSEEGHGTTFWFALPVKDITSKDGTTILESTF